MITGASGKKLPPQLRPAGHDNEQTQLVQEPAAVAMPPPALRQQKQQEGIAASAVGRGRQLDPDAGGAMEALAARAAAAAAEARASGSVATTAASSTVPAAFNAPPGRPTDAKCRVLM